MPLHSVENGFDVHSCSYLPVLGRGDNPRRQAEYTFVDALQETTTLSILSDLKYERRLGEGISFTVDLYKDTSGGSETRQMVAVKSAKVRAQSEQAYDLYSVLREIQLLCHGPVREHSNIITILGYDWRTKPATIPVPVVVVEFAEHGELSQFLQASEPKSQEEKGKFCLDIAKGLHLLHACRIAHGDVKLPNILVAVSEDGKPIAKISDFGHASTAFERNPRKYYSGTRLYVPPEVSEAASLGFEDLCLCDVFAYGLAVWEILNDGKRYYTNSLSTPGLQPERQPVRDDMRRLFYLFLDRTFGDVPFHSEYRAFYEQLLGNTLLQTPRRRYDMGKVVDLLTTHFKQAGTAAANRKSASPFHRIYTGIWNFSPPEHVVPRAVQQKAFADLDESYGTLESEKKGRLLLLMGFCCAHGYGVPISYPKALDYFFRAAESGLLSLKSVWPRFRDAICASFRDERGLAERSLALDVSSGIVGELETRIIASTLTNYTARIQYWERGWIEESLEVSFDITDAKGGVKNSSLLAMRTNKCQDLLGGDPTALSVIAQTSLGTSEIPLLPYIVHMGWLDILDIFLKHTNPGLIDHLYDTTEWMGTLLSAAIINGQAHVTRYLLDHGASARTDVTATHLFLSQWSPFHYLFLTREEEDVGSIARMLLDHGANPNAVIGTFFSIRTAIAPEFPIEMVGTPLNVAVRVGDARTVKALLQHGADPVFRCSATGSTTAHTPLQLAIALHEFEIVALLLECLQQQDRLSEAMGVEKESPLHHISGSIFGGKNLLVRWLLHGSESIIAIEKTIEICLNYGFSIDSVDEDGFSPLMWATMRGPCQNEVVAALLRHGADPRISTTDGRCALTLCAHNLVGDLDNSGPIEALLEAGANVDHQGSSGYSAAHWLAEANATAALDALIASGAFLEPVTVDGETPLYRAIAVGALEAAKLLLDRGAKMDQYYYMKEMGKGKTMSALEYAVVSRHIDIIHELLRRQASIFQEDDLGTVLHHAVNQHSLDIVRVLLGSYRHLFCVPEVLNCLDGWRNTVLHSAAVCDSPLFAQELLLAGAEIDFADPVGEWKRTAVAVATENGSLNALIFLLEAGASPFCREETTEFRDDTSDPRWSFLHEALYHLESNGFGERFEDLLALTRPWIDKFDILNSHDMDGWSPLHYAIFRGRKGCVKALLEFGASLNDEIDAGAESDFEQFDGCSAFEFAYQLRDEHESLTTKAGRVEPDGWAARLEETFEYLLDLEISTPEAETDEKRDEAAEGQSEVIEVERIRLTLSDLTANRNEMI